MNGQTSELFFPSSQGDLHLKKGKSKTHRSDGLTLGSPAMPSPDCISVLPFAVQAEQTWFQAALIRLGVKKNKQRTEDA